MPSSISSSDSNVERPSWAVTTWFFAGLLLGLCLLAGYELLWRHRGFAPTLQDSVERWAKMRQRANRSGPAALVLAGSSRFQLGVDPAVLAAAFPSRAVANLVIDGSASLPVLRDLAEDQNFRGVVLCEVTPTAFFTKNFRHPSGRGAEWASYTKTRPYVAGLESSLRGELQRRFVLMVPGVNPREVLERIAKRRGAPQVDYAPLREDCFREASFLGLDTRAMQAHWAQGFAEAANPPNDAELEQLLQLLDTWSGMIRARGGDVIFVRMISSDPVLTVEERLLPSAQYWRRLATHPATKALHYSELAVSAELSCPDGSHLDRVGARRFTTGLASELRARGWL